MSSNSSNVHHETFVRLFSQYERNVRAFVASLLPNWEGVDEVMQETSLVLWRKFDQFDVSGEESDFLKWAFTIARYEVLNYRRKKATDRLVFSEDIYELLANEAEHIASVQQDWERALQHCISLLQPTARKLIETVYADGISIKEAAERVERSPTALYKALARIRQNLYNCIEMTLKKEQLQQGI